MHSLRNSKEDFEAGAKIWGWESKMEKGWGFMYGFVGHWTFYSG